jgi:hypothetical protein
MNKQDSLARSIERLQQERSVLRGKIEGLEQAQLDFQPSRQLWSIGQVAHHVGLGEKLWQGYLNTALKNGGQKREATVHVSLEDVPFSSRIIPDILWRNVFVLTPLSLMIRLIPRPVHSMLFAVPLVKMDAGPRMQPKRGLPRTQILQFLEETRQATLAMLQPVADWDLTRIRIIHPLVGDQDVYGILELLSSHDQRHSQQIDSIKKNANFPKREK